MKNQLCLILAAVLILPQISFAQDVKKSTIDDQKSVEVSVYNTNLALIKDVRSLNLPKGRGELRFVDVAADINPVTVHVKALGAENALRVLEQNYEYDLMDRNKLLDKYVGKNIQLLETNQYQDRKELIDAELLSNNANQQIYRINGKIYLGHYGIPVLPEIPDNLIAKPTLTWLYDNLAKVNDVEVSYLTTGMSWKADYVLVVDTEDTLADLSGWVSIDNKSGAAYQDAKLKLIAGEINQVTPQNNLRGMPSLTLSAGMALPDEEFIEQGFFEYHIYDLQRPTTLKDNQTKQISLLEQNGINIKKEYLMYGIETYWNQSYNEQLLKQPVNVYIKFKNEKTNKLGMPLPKGIIRLYKQGQAKSLQFIGEDNIEHTPKDEEIKLKVGEAFDIVAEQKQTDYKRITTNLSESRWEIKLKNHKEEDATVGVIIPVFGSWEMIESSQPYTKVDAHTIRFDCPVAKDKEVTVTYTIRVGVGI